MVSSFVDTGDFVYAFPIFPYEQKIQKNAKSHNLNDTAYRGYGSFDIGSVGYNL